MHKILLFKLVHQCVRLFNEVIMNVIVGENTTTLINPYLSESNIHVVYDNIVYNIGTINSLVSSNCTPFCAPPTRQGHSLLFPGRVSNLNRHNP